MGNSCRTQSLKTSYHHNGQIVPEDASLLEEKESRNYTEILLNDSHHSSLKNSRCNSENIAHPSSPQSWVFPFTTDNVRNHYKIRKELRRGSSGVVRLCIHKGTNERFACKTISKLHLTDAGIADILREVELMNTLSNHANIVKIENVFEDRMNVHLIMELCKGGDLSDFMLNSHLGISEIEAATIFRQVAEAVQVCHANHVFHRDLKPENILLAYPEGSHPQIFKLGDFGVATRLKQEEIITGVKGTMYFFAPEMLTGNGTYGLKADVWSLGIVLYVLLMGRLPFKGENANQTYNLIRQAEVDFTRTKPGRSLSVQAEHLLRRILTKDPKDRATLHEILLSPWLKTF